jgi:hypothetical protein
MQPKKHSQKDVLLLISNDWDHRGAEKATRRGITYQENVLNCTIEDFVKSHPMQ